LPAQELQQLDLNEIIRGCQTESRQKRSEEIGYCFELFRRALETSDQGAWTAIRNQYHALLLSWIHTASHGLPQSDVEDLVQESFIAFWRALARRTIQVGKRFPHVGALLSYLRQCTGSAVISYQRHQQRTERLEEELVAIQSNQGSSPLWEKDALEDVYRTELLRKIQNWVETSVTDPQEKLVLHLTFDQGLKPVEIVALHPDRFPETKVVYRVQERVLKRARRALKT
jgi:RNA polymerase sigma factor (sigma-70 family)